MSSKCTMRNFMALLADPRVRTKDPEKVKNAITKLVNGGPEKLQFIVDFDYTITRAHR